MPHSKSVYVMSKGHLTRSRNAGIANCAKCLVEFKENDIIATSTTKHYCYNCAIRVNLVTGKIRNDMHSDEFVNEVISEIGSIKTRLNTDSSTHELATILVTTAVKNTKQVSKNITGLACAAILLACKIKAGKEFDSDSLKMISSMMPISMKTLQKNISMLQNSLTETDVYSISKTIHGLAH